MNLQDALTVIKFRLEEQEKLRRPLAELVDAVTAVIRSEEILRNTPRLAEGAKANHERTIAQCQAEETEAAKRAMAAKKDAAVAIERARKNTASAEETARQRKADLEAEHRDSLEKTRAEIDSLERIIIEQHAQRDALAAELSDLQRRRDEIKQGLAIALNHV